MSDVWRNNKAIQELREEVDLIKKSLKNIEVHLEQTNQQQGWFNKKKDKERTNVLQHNETTRKESHQSKG